MEEEIYRYRKGRERLEGGKIIRLHDINPFEFRGYFEGQKGINWVFQYKDVKRVASKMINIYPFRAFDNVLHPLEIDRKD